MWVPGLADTEWVATVLRTHHRELGLPAPPARVELLDVRISNPHTPTSARCHGWATVRVDEHDDPGSGAAVVLLLQGWTESVTSTAPGGRQVPGLPLLVWRFPADPGLPALRELVDPDALRQRVPYQRAGLDPDLAYDLEARCVRWQPGASATVSVRVDHRASSTELFAKALAGGGAGAIDDAQHWLHETAPRPLRVAEPLGTDEAGAVLWTRAVAGPPLLDRLRTGSPGQVTQAASSVGAAVAAVHASGLRPGRTTTWAAVAAEAEKKAAKVRRAQPGLDTAVAAVAAVATAARDPHPGGERRARPLHGDFHVQQFLDPPSGPVLLDLDEMSCGDPEADLAEFAVDVCLQDLPAETVRRVLVTLCTAYAATGLAVDAGLMRSYAAAEFLNRCYRHLRRPVTGWQQELGRELDRFPVVLAAVDAATSTGPA